MAKRKTARPASRTRTPSAARTAKRAKAASTRRTTAKSTSKRSGAASKRLVRKRVAGKAAAREGPARRGAVKKGAAKNAAAGSRAAGRPTRGGPAKPAARNTRTVVTKRKVATAASARKRTGSKPPRHEYGARGSGIRLQQIERDRRLVEEEVPTPPSSLNLDRRPSAARSGRAEMEEKIHEHTAAGPDLTAGDVDADWEAAYNTGDEAPGGDMPTPDQAVVEEIGTAIGVEYADNEELKGVDKIEQRDRHRWELDPASSEDYQDRARETKKAKG